MLLPDDIVEILRRAALGRAVGDPHTTTGDTMRALVTHHRPTDSQAQMRPRTSTGSTLP
jgi:hypothetical protein